MSDCCAPTARRGCRARWRKLLAWGAATSLYAVASVTHGAEAAAEADPRLAPASSQHAADSARQAIPWKKLSQPDQRRVRYVVRNASLYRRLPTRVEACQPEVFEFLVRRPEVVTSIWKLMGISQLDVERKSEKRFHANDNVGGEGTFELLYSNHSPEARGVTLAMVNGVYHQKPMPRPIRAQCVLLLRSGSMVEANGQPYVTARLDAFVKFERMAADLVARGLQPLVVKTADHNFIETMKFVSTFSRTAETNPAGMRRLAGRLQELDPTARAEMVATCDQASHAASLRTAALEAEQVRLAQLRDASVDAN